MVKKEITLWTRPITKARVGNVKKFVEKNKTMLMKLSTNRNWEVWIRKKKNMSNGIGGAPPTKKRIETGKLNPGITIAVPKTAPKGVIAPVKKNLTPYGKEADKNEPEEISKEALKRGWTTISDNCWGGGYTKALSILRSLPWASPFLGIFFMAPDWITFLENFDEYIKIKPTIQEQVDSKDKFHGRSRYKKGAKPYYKYPVLLLKGSAGEVEIHYAHEKQTPEKAVKKWTTRIGRMTTNKNDMLVKMDDRDRFTNSIGKRFLALKQFPHKILYVGPNRKKAFEGEKDVVFVSLVASQRDGLKLEKMHPVPIN